MILKPAGRIVSINISKKKGEKKTPVQQAVILPAGIENDAHSGDWHRQVSILSLEKISEIAKIIPDIRPGDFAENITIAGVDFSGLKIGDFIDIFPGGTFPAHTYTGDDFTGNAAGRRGKKFISQPGNLRLEVTQIGKECRSPCEIFRKVGYCIMPESGIFCKVIKGGKIENGDKIKIIYNKNK